MLPQPGATFGSYDVIEAVGHGGMGMVYRAVHRDLQRQVALKVLAPQFSGDEEYRARFLSEARTLARLESNHIVAIYDVGEQDGSLYLAMQLITDGDLSTLLKARGPMPVRHALAVLRDVALGLSAAHEAGVLHRDIKPSNVLVRRLPDGSERAYLCDFGIAQAGDASHTKAGGVVGTWSYLAPERLHGAPASPATDVYAMGCLLWVMLSGAAPFGGSSEMEIAMGHLNAPVPQLPGRTPEERGVNDLLQRLMAKDPAYRIPSAAALLAELDHAGAASTRPHSVTGPALAPGSGPGGPSYAAGSPPPGGHGRAPEGRRRARWWVAAAVALAVVAAGLTAVLWDRSGDDDPGGGPDEPEIAFSDDTEPGVVDAELTVAECEADGPEEGLRVGGLAPLTGVFTNQGLAVSSGIGLAVSDINAAGGVVGEDACFQTLDESDADAVDDLVDAEMDAVVGGVGTINTQVAAASLDQADTVLISPGAFNAQIGGTSPYVFRTIGEYRAGGGAVAARVADSTVLDVAVVGTRGVPMEIDWQAAVDGLDRRAIDCLVVCTEADLLPEGTTDYTATANAIVAAQAEGVLITGAHMVTPLLTALDALGWAGEVFFGVNSGGVDLVAPAAQLARGTAVFPAVQAGEEFGQRATDWRTRADGQSLQSLALAAESYDAVVLAALAAQRGGATDPDTIADNLRPVSGSEGGTSCRTYRHCASLLEAGEEVVYRGVAVAAPFDDEGDLSAAYFRVDTFDDAGQVEIASEDPVLAEKP